ncbi:MAG TPA: BREX-3 system P-loop-containing protein BrxF [Steroidobacteraceae bacterium]|nr:BREX-3 system P-loop-containing protein BrxF [Steroidobacteraceae bacterium]
MTGPTSKDLDALCEIAASLYHRLVLIVGPARSGKTRLLQAASVANAWPLINLNQRVSELLLDLTQRQRALRVPRLVDDVLASTRAEVALIDNIELLFSPDLAQDPLRLLYGVARNRTIVASWPGATDGKQLTYAEPSHREYRRYPEIDALCLSLTSQDPPPCADG